MIEFSLFHCVYAIIKKSEQNALIFYFYNVVSLNQAIPFPSSTRHCRFFLHILSHGHEVKQQ